MRTSTPHHGPRITSVTRNLDAALDGISAGAAARDAEPAFPEGPFRGLAASGVLGMTAPRPQTARERPVSFEREWRTLRAVARADGSVGRILDGHFNAVERLSVLAPEPLRSSELEAVARLTSGGGHVSGVKTFCSGSTGLDRAVVLVRGEDGVPGPPLVAYVDLSEGAEVDTTWFRGHGMRSSESHRVVFGGARVLAVLGGPGELLREPYFSRDAVRTAVTWAGIADLAVDSALDVLAVKTGGGDPDDLASLAAGRLLAARGTIDRWFEFAAARADADPGASLSEFSTQLREAVAASCRTILDEAARAVGSYPFATAGPLDRARRDLELFLLQHRLEPALARRGRRAIRERLP
jgi:alkylation response protein AidB-like acyl-CoA dehydrogenase